MRLLNKVICYTKNAHPNRDERGARGLEVREDDVGALGPKERPPPQDQVEIAQRVAQPRKAVLVPGRSVTEDRQAVDDPPVGRRTQAGDEHLVPFREGERHLADVVLASLGPRLAVVVGQDRDLHGMPSCSLVEGET